MLPLGGRTGRFPKLITTGLIDPARCLWGERATRFDGRVYRAPRINLDRLQRTTGLGPWARDRLRPKVLLATQTRILEAAIDERGRWLPAVPLITITPRRRTDLWHIAAVLLSPVATAWAIRHYAGAGLSADAIKLSAKQVLTIPIPPRRTAWNRAAQLIRAAATAPDQRREILLARAGADMCRAYGLPPDDATALIVWWQRRARPRTPRRQDRV